jgi:hypothetical protein
VTNRAEVIELATYRREPTPHGWHDLHYVGQSDRRDGAAVYARLGMHPMLLHGVTETGCTCGDLHVGSERSIGKHPVHKGWQRAVLDVAELDRHLQRDWRYNIGLRMGAQPDGSRLIAIDVDGDPSLLDPLIAQWGQLPPTLVQTSGKGLHYIFRWPAGRDLPKNAVRIAPGVDVRSEGGQIVAAPSWHRCGRVYRWLKVREPAVLP